MGKTWIYIIRTSKGKMYNYYVGVTDRLRQRLYEHQVGSCNITQNDNYNHLCAIYEVVNTSNFTREYYENLIVKQLMYLSKNYWNCIRGGSWCQKSIKKPSEIEKIEKFPVCGCGFPKWYNKCPKQMVSWYSKNIDQGYYKCLDMCQDKYHQFCIFKIKCEFCNHFIPSNVSYYTLCEYCDDIYRKTDSFENFGWYIEKYKGQKLMCNHETKYYINVLNNCICVSCLLNIFRIYMSPSTILKDNFDDFLLYIDEENDFFLEKTEQLEKYTNLYELKEIYRWYLYGFEKQIKECKHRPKFL